MRSGEPRGGVNTHPSCGERDTIDALVISVTIIIVIVVVVVVVSVIVVVVAIGEQALKSRVVSSPCVLWLHLMSQLLWYYLGL